MKMLKRINLISGIVTVLAVVVVAGIAQIISVKNSAPTSDIEEKEVPFEIKVKTVSGAIYTTKDIPLDIVFHNSAKEPTKLLDSFNSPAEKRIFFSIILRDANKTPLFNVGGGKIDIARDSLKYIELKEDEETTVRINLMDYDIPVESLKAGVYSVLVTYRNQYGENCFKGTLESELYNLVLVH